MFGCGLDGDRATSGSTDSVVPIVSVDGPTYSSVESLAEDTQIVVRGTVQEVMSREIDSGGGSDKEGIPIELVGFAVSYSNDPSVVAVGETVPIAWTDMTQIHFDPPVGELPRGSELLIFGTVHGSADSPGVETVKRYLVPTGADYGVFDVRNGIATAREPALASLTASVDESISPRALSAPVDSILKTAERYTGR